MRQWSDLSVRLSSGGLLALAGLWSIWMGGHVFHIIVSLVCGLMVWELVRMVAPRNRPMAMQLGAFAVLAGLIASYLPLALATPLLLAPALVGYGVLQRGRKMYLVFAVLVLLAGFGMTAVRDDLGFAWMAWLVLVVIATDVMGYFAGRAIGGPKLWPAVSPKKTWSGAIGGWLGAALVGFGFFQWAYTDISIVWLSVAVSMASQAGDIAESAVKRRMGVKDSSNLIPGHGGVLDRFDGMLGAAVFLIIAGHVIGFPLRVS